MAPFGRYFAFGGMLAAGYCPITISFKLIGFVGNPLRSLVAASLVRSDVGALLYRQLSRLNSLLFLQGHAVVCSVVDCPFLLLVTLNVSRVVGRFLARRR